ncbi:MAG: NADH-ubiquinone oxidoreductase-F iron-sulfur binding region domain-containing protein [Gammaproteobacteria bacterium]
MASGRAFVPLESAAVALGADSVAELLGERGFEVIRTGSRGCVWAEPCIELEQADGTRLVYANVTTDAIRGAERPFDDLEPFGTVDDLLVGQTRLVFDNCGAIDPLSLDAYRAAGGFAALTAAPDEIAAEIERSGLRGRGGAGFPAHVKWRTVAETPADQKWIVCNADEGDSGTFADRMLMEGDPFRLIEGMVMAGYATGASKGVVYLRSEYPTAAKIFARALEIARSAGLIGADCVFDIDLFIGAGAYICGEETSLLESLEGRRGEIRTKPPVPAIAGLFDQPTLVHNVISLASVPWILTHGGAAYAAYGVGASTGTMPFQLSGNVARGGLVELPFGVTLGELVEDWAGGTRSGRPVRAVQVGGPLGAYLAPRHFDTAMTYEALAALGAGVGHGGIVVYDDTVDLAEQARFAFEFCAIESCGKCTPCRIGAVRGEETIRNIMNGRDEFAILEDLCDVMEKASLCQMGGMTPIPVRSALRHFPEDFRRVEVQ